MVAPGYFVRKPMRVVRQRFGTDCGVACVAIVAGCRYEVAFQAFGGWPGRDFSTNTTDVKFALGQLGVSTGLRATPMGWKVIEEIDSDAMVIVNVAPGGTSSHWVVWDHIRRKILDPAKRPALRYRYSAYLRVFRE